MTAAFAELDPEVLGVLRRIAAKVDHFESELAKGAAVPSRGVSMDAPASQLIKELRELKQALAAGPEPATRTDRGAKEVNGLQLIKLTDVQSLHEYRRCKLRWLSKPRLIKYW